MREIKLKCLSLSVFFCLFHAKIQGSLAREMMTRIRVNHKHISFSKSLQETQLNSLSLDKILSHASVYKSVDDLTTKKTTQYNQDERTKVLSLQCRPKNLEKSLSVRK